MLRKSLFFAALALTTFLIPGGLASLAAENPSLQQRIEAASGILGQLDSLASSCLETDQNHSEPAATANERTPGPCTSFMEAIDGDLLGNYLQHCNALKSWRDDYVTSTIDTDSSTSQSQEDLQLMVGIEYNCGENALLRRTQYVAQAFEIANQRNILLQSLNAANLNNRNRLSEFELRNRLNSERHSLLRAVQQEHQRQLQNTQDQFYQLENELIRQQINRPR